MRPEKQLSKLAEFFYSERKRLIRFAQRLIDDTAERDSEDIVHDVVLNLFNRSDVTVPIENISAYVYQAIRNRIVDLLRKRKLHETSMEGKIFENSGMALGDLIHDYTFNPARQLDVAETRDRIFKAIAALDDKYKAIIIETEFENRSYAELADLWGISIGTLLARKSRALKKIREILTAAT